MRMSPSRISAPAPSMISGVITDQSENVFPMVPGGKGLTEMILAEEL